jgi:hypothetical protein
MPAVARVALCTVATETWGDEVGGVRLPMVSSLRVPDQHRKALIQLTKLNPEETERLRAAVAAAGSSPQSVENAIAEAIEDADAQLFSALVSLTTYRTSHDISTDEIASQIAAALGDEAGDADLSAVLAAPRLVALAKAFDLSLSYERKLHTFRVVTEVRPIFGENATDEPAEFLLQHQLEISHYHNNRLQTMLIAIDRADLDPLRKQIERAAEKEISLRSRIEKSGGIIVDLSEGGL